MNWSAISPPSPLTTPIFDFETLKAHLNCYDEEEELVMLYAAAAQATIEGTYGIGIPLLTRGYRLSLTGLPLAFDIPLCPVVSIESITYTDETGAVQTLDPALYSYDLDTAPVTVAPTYGKTWPAAICQPGSVKVNFKAGFGDTGADIPADLRAAMLLIVGHHYTNRESVSAVETFKVPDTVEAILSRYRVIAFG